METPLNAPQLLALLNSQLKLEQLMPALLDTILELTGATRAFLVLSDGQPDFSIVSARSRQKEDLEEGQFPGSSSIVRKVLEEKAALYIPCLPANQDFKTAPSVRAGALQSVICVPLWHSAQSGSEGLLGAIYVDSTAPLDPLLKEEHLRFIQGLANHVSVSIENAKLFSQLEEKNKEIEKLNRRLRSHGKEAEEQAEAAEQGLADIVGKSAAMLSVFRVLEKVVSTDATVLVQGESGTGKELVARYLHANGPRAGKRLLSLNCAAFNEPLLESELFGHRKGAFTGADQHKMGVFQLADHGTLFLDEVGDMSLEMQKKLLRVLQNGEIRPIGSDQTFQVDVRIIAASNRNLRELVQAGKFREDLYFRLNVIQVFLPPLRHRREDIPLLIEHIARKLSDELRKPLKPLPEKLMRRFVEYDWPGNVRELENEMRRLLILDAEYSPDQLQAISAGTAETLNLVDLEKNAILKAMEVTQGNKTRAAELLGIPLRTLYERLKKYGLA